MGFRLVSNPFSVGVDIGGTFTDLVGFGLEDGEIVITKARSTSSDLTQGIMACVAKSEIPLGSVETLFHGSTLLINAIIERTGAKTALITTRGFRDVLEIGRGNRPENYNLLYRKTVAPVRLTELSLRPDSGGAGRRRGGLGVIMGREVIAPTCFYQGG